MSLGRVLTDDPGMWKRIVSWCHYLQNVLEITLPGSGESITSQALSPQEAHSLVETSSVPWLTRMAFLVQLRTNQSSELQALTACSQPLPGHSPTRVSGGPAPALLCISMSCRSEPFCSPARSPAVPSFLEHFCCSSSNCSFSFLIWRGSKGLREIQSLKWNRCLAWCPHLRIRPQIIHSETVSWSAYHGARCAQVLEISYELIIKRSKLQEQVSQLKQPYFIICAGLWKSTS